ncbi:MAG: DUF2334 domain-containing protein [Meiothermus sp.]|nr:DUF2334 domain-containing protein [Meiothermus sp.]
MRTSDWVWRGLLGLALLLAACTPASSSPPDPGPPPVRNTVQILYDLTAGTNSDLTGVGLGVPGFNPDEAAQLYATLLANLLGRYPDLKVRVAPVSSYSGLEADVLRVFYIGSVFDATPPEALLRDAEGGGPITWLGYNLWKLGDRQSGLGLRYRRVLSAVTAEEVDDSFSTVRYRDYAYQKLTRSGDAVVPNQIVQVDSGPDNRVHAWAEKPGGERTPYAVQSGGFWYIADIPFTYAHELDRYLVFADLLGVMLGRDETCLPRALIRLEDAEPTDTPADLQAALDVLERLQIPFAVATIPRFTDGVNNFSVEWTDRPQALEQLRRVERIGGRIVGHGYTHQYKSLRNPSGVSGTDWEFWDITRNQPIPGMTPAEALLRVQTGDAILRGLGLNPAAWVTPHYMMPPGFYPQLNPLYPRFFERRLYQAGQTYLGQFFPYPVRDVSGALMLPENTNLVNATRRPADIVEIARANRALRCPWLGTFFHPYLLGAPAASGGVTPQEFEQMLSDIRNLGYTFVDINSVDLGQ